MPVDKPTPGNLIQTVAELVDSVNAGSFVIPEPPALAGGFGFSGGFGVDIINPIVNPNGFIVFEEAYILTSATPSLITVDNSYMFWDPLDGPDLIIKQAGWYQFSVIINFSAGLASTGLWATGSNQMNTGGDIAVSAGQHINASGLLYYASNYPASLQIVATGTLNYASLSLVPLFVLGA